MSPIWVAMVLVVASCVSDDQASEPPSSAPAAETASETPTTQVTSTETSEPTSTAPPQSSAVPDTSNMDQNAAVPRTNKRTQGAPITVATVGAPVLGKAVIGGDVKVVKEWCGVSEAGGLLALAEVANPGALAGDFILEFEVLNALGVRVGEGLDVVHDVKAGQSFVARDAIVDAVGWEGDARAWTCQVLRVSPPDPVLN